MYCHNYDDKYILTKRLLHLAIFVAALTPWIIGDILDPPILFKPLTIIRGITVSAVILVVGYLGLNILLEGIEKEMRFVNDLNENIVKNSPFAILTLDKDGFMTSCNPKFLEILNEPSEEVLLNEDAQAKKFFEDLGLNDKIFAALKGHSFSVSDIKSTLHDREIVFNVRCAVMRDSDGLIDGLLIIIEDCTERFLMSQKLKNSYTKLQSAYGELKILGKVKDEIIANVSHELRTPLTICKTSIEVAMEESDENEKVALLKMTQSALQRLNDKVDDLITISDIQKGRFRLHKKGLDLGRIIHRIVIDNKQKIKEKGVHIDIDIEKNLPKLKVDEKSIGKAITNLIDNAVKFNIKNGKISIRAKKIDHSVEVRIKDTGIGINKDQFKNIFKRFFQVDGSTTRCYSGAGLGLPVAKEIIESHDGEIFVKSELNVGSEFTFTLPI